MDMPPRLNLDFLSSKFRSPRKVLSRDLLLLGVSLLGYVGSEYWGMYRTQKQLEAQPEQKAATVRTPGQPRLAAHDLLTRVSIPKISLDAIVIECVSCKPFSSDPGRKSTTTLTA